MCLKMRLSHLTLPVALVPALLFTSLAAHAQLTVTNISQDTPLYAGGESYFTATLTNTGTDVLDLNNISIDFLSPAHLYLTEDTNPFFNNTPPSLNGGDSWTGDLFGVIAASNTPAEGYQGALTISGLDENTNGNYSTLPPPGVAINVSSLAPEPSSAALIAAGLFAVSVLAGPFRRASLRRR